MRGPTLAKIQLAEAQRMSEKTRCESTYRFKFCSLLRLSRHSFTVCSISKACSRGIIVPSDLPSQSQRGTSELSSSARTTFLSAPRVGLCLRRKRKEAEGGELDGGNKLKA